MIRTVTTIQDDSVHKRTCYSQGMKRSLSFKHLPGLKKRSSVNTDDLIRSGSHGNYSILPIRMMSSCRSQSPVPMVSPEINANPATAALENILNGSPLSIDDCSSSESDSRSDLMMPSLLFEVTPSSWFSEVKRGAEEEDVIQSVSNSSFDSEREQVSHNFPTRIPLYPSISSLSDDGECKQASRSSSTLYRANNSNPRIKDGENFSSCATSQCVSVVPPLAFMPSPRIERHRTSNKRYLDLMGYNRNHIETNVEHSRNRQSTCKPDAIGTSFNKVDNLSVSTKHQPSQLRMSKVEEVGKLAADLNRVLLLNYSKHQATVP